MWRDSWEGAGVERAHTPTSETLSVIPPKQYHMLWPFRGLGPPAKPPNSPSGGYFAPRSIARPEIAGRRSVALGLWLCAFFDKWYPFEVHNLSVCCCCYCCKCKFSRCVLCFSWRRVFCRFVLWMWWVIMFRFCHGKCAKIRPLVSHFRFFDLKCICFVWGGCGLCLRILAGKVWNAIWVVGFSISLWLVFYSTHSHVVIVIVLDFVIFAML